MKEKIKIINKMIIKNNSLLFFLIIMFLKSNTLLSQDKSEIRPKDQRQANNEWRNANKMFAKEDYAEAEVFLKKALAIVSQDEKVSFNLGNAIFKQKRYKEAVNAYENIAKTTKDDDLKFKSFHNLGNSQMQIKEYQKAIEAYKNALRINPLDEETRYNLALAQKFLKENPPKKDKNDKDQKDKENKDKKDEKKEDPKEQPKDSKKEDNSDKDKKEEDKNQKEENKPQIGKMSEQQMKQLLEALNNEEKKTQEKVKLQNIKTKPVPKEKDW